MATLLPNQGMLHVPIDWSGEIMKNTMEVGAYKLSGTVGFKPWRETATLTWTLTKDQANAMLNQFELDHFNAVYDYTCWFRGSVKLRPTTSYSFQERRGTQMLTFMMTFDRL